MLCEAEEGHPGVGVVCERRAGAWMVVAGSSESHTTRWALPVTIHVSDASN